MLTFTLSLSKFRDTLINDSNNFMIQKRKYNIAIGFLCHLQAHRNYTLLVGWFVYLLGMRFFAENRICSFEQLRVNVESDDDC